MGLEEALILLYLLVDDGYRAVTFGGTSSRISGPTQPSPDSAPPCP